MLPLRIYTRKRIFNYYSGLSFFVFIWIYRATEDESRLIRHEKIHFLQQIELLFIFHWIFYAFFYLLTRSRGHGHYIAYRYNPFELEAYDNEHDHAYLTSRRRFAWTRSVKTYYDMWRSDFCGLPSCAGSSAIGRRPVR